MNGTQNRLEHRALGRHVLLRIRGPHYLNFQGPQAKFEGSLHWNTITLPILQFQEVHWALKQNFTRAPLDFQGPGTLPPGPREPWWTSIIHVTIVGLLNCLLPTVSLYMLYALYMNFNTKVRFVQFSFVLVSFCTQTWWSNICFFYLPPELLVLLTDPIMAI